MQKHKLLFKGIDIVLGMLSIIIVSTVAFLHICIITRVLLWEPEISKLLPLNANLVHIINIGALIGTVFDILFLAFIVWIVYVHKPKSEDTLNS